METTTATFRVPVSVDELWLLVTARRKARLTYTTTTTGTIVASDGRTWGAR